MIDVAVETPWQDDVRVLVTELNRTLLALTPGEFCFHMTVEQMAEPSTTLFVARDDGQAVACGALKRHDGGIGEVKRIPGRAIAAAGSARRSSSASRRWSGAKASGAWCSKPADRHPAAWTVYERAGFSRCGPVLDHPDSRYSVFYEKDLMAG
jgi:putative acetyltransferase